MRRERVAQAVRVAEEPADRARVEATAADRQEDGVVRPSRESRPSGLEVARDMESGFLAERYDALLAALSSHMDDLAVEVDVTEVERDRFGAPEPRGVEELEECAVAKRERR